MVSKQDSGWVGVGVVTCLRPEQRDGASGLQEGGEARALRGGGPVGQQKQLLGLGVVGRIACRNHKPARQEGRQAKSSKRQ
jgi:hypothetical protein